MLTLPIKKKWFDMILSGEKKEEYREIKPYYTKRFQNLWKGSLIGGDAERDVLFRNGYSKNSPSFVAIVTLDTGKGKKEWGAECGVDYYRLHIKRISIRGKSDRMTLDEAISMYANNAEYERIPGSLQGCLDLRQLAAWLSELKAYKERIPSYEEGYNDAKREIALSGEYERAYERGKDDAQTERWNPISERLPEDRRGVLVTAYWHETYQVMMASYFGDGLWWCVPFNNCGEHMQRLKPKAWMPLPRPYKMEVVE